MQTAMHEVFEEDDMRQIFRWLHKFLNNPYSEDDQLVPAGDQPQNRCMAAAGHNADIHDATVLAGFLMLYFTSCKLPVCTVHSQCQLSSPSCAVMPLHVMLVP